MDGDLSIKKEKKQWLLTHTYFALFSVQVELVLADSHDPNGFDQRMAGIPRVDE